MMAAEWWTEMLNWIPNRIWVESEIGKVSSQMWHLFFLVVTCKDHSNEARAQKRHMKGLNIVDLFESLVGRT